MSEAERDERALISIHAPMRGATNAANCVYGDKTIISIHAPMRGATDTISTE